MPKSTPRTRTAADVRAFFHDEAKGEARTMALPEAARKCLSPTARGRLHPEAITAFNKGKAVGLRYNSGASGQVASEAKAQAATLRALAVEQGVVKAGQVGPLPKAFLIAQGVIKG